MAENTREGKVLARILEKLEEIRTAIGTDKVFDVIGDVFHGKDIYKLVSEAVSGERSVDEIEEEINIPLDEEYKKALIDELLNEGLVDSIDYKAINDLSELTQESRLVPEYLEAFFLRALDKMGGGKLFKEKSKDLIIFPLFHQTLEEKPMIPIQKNIWTINENLSSYYI